MTISEFQRGDLIDASYQVACYLGSDDLRETYRVKTIDDELKLLKLIKADSEPWIEWDKLQQALAELNTLEQPGILNASELKIVQIQGAMRHYFLHDFVSGESLTACLNRQVSIGVYEACKIIRSSAQALAKLDDYQQYILTPDNIFINYLGEEKTIAIFPLNLLEFIKETVISTPRYFLAYKSKDKDYYSEYSLATVLYQCLFGILPWQYDIEWRATYTAVQYQIFSYRDTNPLKPSSLYTQYIPEDLKSIMFQALNNIELENFSKHLDVFIKQYYEFPYYESIQSATGLVKPPLSHLPKNAKSSESLEKSISSEFTRSQLGLHKIAGMNDLKTLLMADIVEPLRNKGVYEEYGIQSLNGILFYGPPGCGKTFIARQLAAELGYSFFEIKPSDLASVYVHGTQEKIGKLFLEASLKAPSVIFIDEVDAILPSRDTANMSQHYASEVNEFLAQLNQCNEKGILAILATNRPDAIDKAVLRTGRIDKAVYIPLPDFMTRKEMLNMLLNGRPIDSGLDIDAIAMLLSSYTSSDINYIVNEAAKLALNTNSKIGKDQLMTVIRKTKSSINYEQLEKYDAFAQLQRF